MIKKSKLEVMESLDCWFIFFSFYVRSDELCFPVKTGFQKNDCISLIRGVGLKKNVSLVVNVEDQRCMSAFSYSCQRKHFSL
jgi:hypothetical protein